MKYEDEKCKITLVMELYVGTMQQLCAFLWQFREGETFLHSFPVGISYGNLEGIPGYINESSWLMLGFEDIVTEKNVLFYAMVIAFVYLACVMIRPSSWLSSRRWSFQSFYRLSMSSSVKG